MPLTPQQRARLSLGLQKVARKLDKLLQRETGGDRVGFSLIIWGAFGEDQMVQYVSNADRADCEKYMSDLLSAWRSGMPDLPCHERQ